jgi:ribosomal protein S18 acetylase RimI-like enzyme
MRSSRLPARRIRAVASVTFRALREDEFEAWAAEHTRGYAEGMIALAGLPRGEAEAKAAADVAAVLPHGIATERTHLWLVEDESGRRVGSVFLGVRDGGAWLYDITIDESERGRGFGRAAMLALEDEVRALGFAELGLNVWGGNEVARSLYRSLGYAEISVGMKKRF